MKGKRAYVLAPADGLITRVDTSRTRRSAPGATTTSSPSSRCSTSTSSGCRWRARSSSPATPGAQGGRLPRGRRRRQREAPDGRSAVPTATSSGVRQIAGLLARRVVCYLKEGDRVHRGQSMGLIKFSSRVDLLVPESYRVLVKKGDRVKNGATPDGHARGGALIEDQATCTWRARRAASGAAPTCCPACSPWATWSPASTPSSSGWTSNFETGDALHRAGGGPRQRRRADRPHDRHRERVRQGVRLARRRHHLRRRARDAGLSSGGCGTSTRTPGCSPSSSWSARRRGSPGSTCRPGWWTAAGSSACPPPGRR